MVWIPGGGFFSGAGNSYEVSKLATRGDVVVVTVTYRLGIFGFFGYPGLAGSGTYGIQDQQAALRWVQRNARAFGGDPRDRHCGRGVGRRDERVSTVDLADVDGVVSPRQ